MKYIFVILCIALLTISCSETVARRPVTQKSGSYVKTKTITRNIERVAQEEKALKKVIESDTINDYQSSASGFWYYYNKKNLKLLTIQKNQIEKQQNDIHEKNKQLVNRNDQLIALVKPKFLLFLLYILLL